jgi:hypothetical protein
LYAAAIQEDEVFKNMSPDTLADVIQQGQVDDHPTGEILTMLASLGAIWPMNKVFWPRCYVSTRVTGSSMTVSSTTECSFMFQLLEEPVWSYFGATTMT